MFSNFWSKMSDYATENKVILYAQENEPTTNYKIPVGTFLECYKADCNVKKKENGYLSLLKLF